MRVIERKMLQAIHSVQNFKCDNTEVVAVNFLHGGLQRCTVLLHGSPIATVTDTTLEVSDCGWQTPTTKSRLNVLLHEFSPGWGIYQKNKIWYLSGPTGETELEPEAKTVVERLR